MKTMNTLFLMGLLISSSACTNYVPDFSQNSEEEITEIENVYLELHLHQIYLERRDAQLVVQIEEVMTNLETGEGNEEDNMSLLEELQVEKAFNLELFDYNNTLLTEVGNVAIIRPPKLPCSDEPDPFGVCPVPGIRSTPIWVFDGQEIESAVQEDENGEIYARFSGLESVEGPDEFSEMVFEQSGEGNPMKMIISKPNPIGDGIISYITFFEQ